MTKPSPCFCLMKCQIKRFYHLELLLTTNNRLSRSASWKQNRGCSVHSHSSPYTRTQSHGTQCHSCGTFLYLTGGSLLLWHLQFPFIRPLCIWVQFLEQLFHKQEETTGTLLMSTDSRAFSQRVLVSLYDFIPQIAK